MGVNGFEHTFKAFERIEHSRKIIMVIISRTIPNIWSVLRSRGPQDPNQSKLSKSKKIPWKKSPLSQTACSSVIKF